MTIPGGKQSEAGLYMAIVVAIGHGPHNARSAKFETRPASNARAHARPAYRGAAYRGLSLYDMCIAQVGPLGCVQSRPLRRYHRW